MFWYWASSFLRVMCSMSGNFSIWLLLTHWGRVTHICVSKLTIIGSDNGLSPDRRQAIIWTNAGLLLVGPLGTNFSEILIEILTFSFKKMCLKVSSAKWRPFCLGLSVLSQCHFCWYSKFFTILQFTHPYSSQPCLWKTWCHLLANVQNGP